MASRGPIRVLLIAPSLEIVGGQAVQAARLLACLRAVPGLEVAFQPINPGIGLLRRIRYVRTLANAVVYWASLAARVWRYDVLHVFSASYWSYTLWTLPALLFAKLYRKKIVLNYRDGQAEDHLRNWRSAVPSIRLMDRVVAPSGYLVDVFSRFAIDASCIFNIIERGEFPFRERRKVRPILLHNRGLEPLYNVECTLRAFQRIQARYPEAKLTLAHDGPSRRPLEELARKLKLRNVEFLGSVPHCEMREHYHRADIYVMTPNLDCMPGSLLECFASGLPVVATAAGGIPYIAKNEVTALLVPCDDDEAIARSVFRLLEDEALVARLVENARKEVMRYAPALVADQWAALYRELVHCETAPSS